MPRVITSVRATQDLDDIWFYIAQDNVAAADALIDAIEQRCGILAGNPLMGRARPELAPEVRSYSVDRYVAFYRPHPDGIELVRVLHGARHLPGIVEGGGLTE